MRKTTDQRDTRQGTLCAGWDNKEKIAVLQAEVRQLQQEER